MKTKKAYFFCSPKLLQNIEQLKEIDACLLAVQWRADFHLEVGNKKYSHQTGYNKAFEIEFSKFGWIPKPSLIRQSSTYWRLPKRRHIR